MNRNRWERICGNYREFCTSRRDRAKRRAGRLYADQRGAAMVTMIVVVLFITILATTLLYISGMNFQIKQTDYRNQKSFYAGETTLEQIRAQLIADVSEAAGHAYESVCADYMLLGTGDARQWEYNHRFVDELRTNWNLHGDWQAWLGGYQTAGATLTLEAAMDTDGNGVFSTAEVLDAHEDDGYVVIKGIKVTYTNTSGYTSVIETEFYVQAPTLNWKENGSEMTAIADPLAKDQAKIQTKVEAADYVEYVNWEKR